MPKLGGATCCISLLWAFLAFSSAKALENVPSASLQPDGSLVFFDSKGGVTDLVKKGTPRQGVLCGELSLNVSYGYNSSGKVTILISLPIGSSSPAFFNLLDRGISISPGSSLRITLNDSFQAERLEGTPAGHVLVSNSFDTYTPDSRPGFASNNSSPVEDSNQTTTSSSIHDLGDLKNSQNQFNANPIAQSKPGTISSSPSQETSKPEQEVMGVATPAPTSSAPALSVPEETFWPGNYLGHPIPEAQREEDRFYVRTEAGARFVGPMNIVNITGATTPSNPLIQEKISFSTGYRQDLDAGVWLTDWFGLALETGFAVNSIRGNSSGMTVSNSNYWSVPLMAQLCFQYPNETGFLPYINLGFGGGWNLFEIGSISYNGSRISGSGHDLNNAYQVTAGLRYRLYEQLSLSLAYKCYGTSQPTMGMDSGQQVTFGSPFTNTIEIGGNFSF